MNTTTPPPPVGNAEAMREALVRIIETAKAWAEPGADAAITLGLIVDMAESALAAPPRNCDRFATWQEAKAAFWREVGDPADWQRLLEWLYAHSHVEYK